MTQITITLNTTNAAEAAKAKLSLQKIANKVSNSNLKFLADLADKAGINEKLEDPLNRLALKTKL